jgi:hypothetical protein
MLGLIVAATASVVAAAVCSYFSHTTCHVGWHAGYILSVMSLAVVFMVFVRDKHRHEIQGHKDEIQNHNLLMEAKERHWIGNHNFLMEAKEREIEELTDLAEELTDLADIGKQSQAQMSTRLMELEQQLMLPHETQGMDQYEPSQEDLDATKAYMANKWNLSSS